MYYLLTYTLVPDYLERRGEFRMAHFEHLKPLIENGSLCLGGALADPADKALLLFNGDSPEVAENCAKNDPYLLNGLIESWEVRPWTIVAGAGVAAM